MANNRVPEFISLMRTIRDVYYKEMSRGLNTIKLVTPTFEYFMNQIRGTRATSDVLSPGEDPTVVVQSNDPTGLIFHFGLAPGPEGIQGPEGPEGPSGPGGTGLQFQGEDTIENILLIDPTGLVVGDCYQSTNAGTMPGSEPVAMNDVIVITNDGTNPNVWTNFGPLRGIQGPTGPAGPTGAEGGPGPTGPTGTRGSIWTTSPVELTPGLPAGVMLGDFYIHQSDDGLSPDTDGNYYLYKDLGGGAYWDLQGKFDGPQGIKGDPGSVWYNDSTTPDDALGRDGDYFLDTTTNFYYHKTLGAWGASIGGLGDWDGIGGKPTTFPPVPATSTDIGGAKMSINGSGVLIIDTV